MEDALMEVLLFGITSFAAAVAVQSGPDIEEIGVCTYWRQGAEDQERQRQGECDIPRPPKGHNSKSLRFSAMGTIDREVISNSSEGDRFADCSGVYLQCGRTKIGDIHKAWIP
jgi:hypothetical protein